MKKVVIKIEVTGIENWDVDWENPEAVKHELNDVDSTLKKMMSTLLGIYSQNIEVKSELSV